MRQDEWLSRAAAHRARTAHWVEPRLQRRAVGDVHPVWDFLFDYYPISPAKLSTWHPGFPTILEGAEADTYLAHAGYRRHRGGVGADIAFLHRTLARLSLAIRILEGTLSRPAVTGCFALHEWAMTYRLAQQDVRHSSLPLRLAPDEIARTVESVGLRCTHIDAYRFFTPGALALNAVVPTRETQPDMEQPGCLHAAMDLYKMAAWFLPLTGSDLLMDCFENAAQGRMLDMRASPYDVSRFGLEPIRVESAAGRRQYALEQQRLITATEPLRRRLLAELHQLRDAYQALSSSGTTAAYAGDVSASFDDLDLLPEQTSDEIERPESRDDWLRGEVPPHHG